VNKLVELAHTLNPTAFQLFQLSKPFQAFPSTFKPFQVFSSQKMNTYEERVQAKMAAIIAAEEDKEITMEAIKRLEKTKQEIRRVANIAARDMASALLGATYASIQDAIKVSSAAPVTADEIRRALAAAIDPVAIAAAADAEAYRDAARAADQAAKAAAKAADQEKQEQMKLLIRLAFESYYSRRLETGLFKKRQKELIDCGVTTQHFDNPTINCIREIGVYQRHLPSGPSAAPPPIPLYFLLTAEKPYAEAEPSWSGGHGIQRWEWRG